jgi:hypothetical protein
VAVGLHINGNMNNLKKGTQMKIINGKGPDFG